MNTSLKQKIDYKFRLKYGAFSLVMISMAVVIGIIVYQYFGTVYWEAELFAIAFAGLALYLNYRYWKYDLRGVVSDREYILSFLEYYIQQNYENGDFKYIESLRWFSRDVAKIYYNCNNHDQIFEVTNKLHRALNSDGRCLCKASFKKDDFIELCKQLKLAIVENRSNKEIGIDSKMDALIDEINNAPEYVMSSKAFIQAIVSGTAFVYFLVAALHLFGCYMISEPGRDLMGNIFLVIPGDVLLILIYNNIVKEKKN